MYVCKFCKKEFEKQQGWASHECKCKLNPNRNNAMKHLSYARSCKTFSGSKKDTNVYYCQYCERECIGKNSLSNHERLCKNNPNKEISNFVKYNKDCQNNITHHPHKGQTKFTSESLHKMSITKNEKFKNGELKGSFVNRKHTNETKEKIRISTFKYLQQLKDIKCPRYNKKSIEYINELNRTNNWNLQHAENGGEFFVGGYFLDGYDKQLNIAFEYDEPAHYKNVKDNILNEKDLERQQYIIEKLNCEFWRYNELTDTLYKVN